MITIYCIEDINNLKYVGSTKLTLKERFKSHKSHKKRDMNISSSKLDLDNCKMYSLETCNESNRMERESYWINKLDCVNVLKLNYDNKAFCSRYYQDNKEKLKKQRENNKEKRKEYMKQWSLNNKECKKEHNLFRSKKVVNGCYEFIKMLEEY